MGTAAAPTVADLIRKSLITSGAVGKGESIDAEDANDAFNTMIWMLGQWQRQRFLIWQLVDTAKISTGAQSYTVGPGGDFNITGGRPDRLEAAFFRQLTQSQPAQIDYPLEILEAREDYNNIALKQLTAFPSYIFYDPGVPLGRVYPWPIPQSAIYEVHLTTKMVINNLASLSTTVVFPPEYFLAIYLNLALLLRVDYNIITSKMEDDRLPILAKNALSVLRGANAQIPRLTMPTDLVRPGIYNPYSDQIR